MATEGRLHTEARPIDDLVDDVLSGAIRIPSFQRGLKWQRPDVIRLFDSIVRGYPVGNLLLWRRRAGAAAGMRIGALRIDAKETDAALFVVDGQQRLTSLANALSDEGHIDPRFALAYDVDRERFVPSQNKSVFEIPLPIIFDLTKLLRWFADNSILMSDPAYIDRANKVAKAIREFRVPVYVVEQSEEGVLRDIFDRMNNYGRKLTRAEVFSALHESGEGERSETTHDLTHIASEVHAETGYGVVDDSTVLLAFLGRRGANISRDIRREFDLAANSPGDRYTSEFPREDAGEARDATIRAMVLAVKFLQDEAGAPHFAFLPYRYLLVVLTRFFAHHPWPAVGTTRNLRRWFWRAAVLGPQVTKGNITYATRSLCDRIVPGEESRSVEGLLEMVAGPPASEVEVTDFRTNHAVTRIMVAALWDLRPMPLSGYEDVRGYSMDDLLEALGEQSTANEITPSIFTSSTFPVRLRSLAGNRVMVPDPAGTVESVRDSLWRVAVDRIGGESKWASSVLRSHAVTPDAAQALISGDEEGFVRMRQASLSAHLRTFLARQAEWSFEDTPSLDLLIVEDDPRDDNLEVN
ncbi:DUF262 domain-containing protein [Microbacterium sp. Leaf151]|uniref:DUF262 domain-containing protein n=1 Tax=Microbacterium sp. Leaf151 TaxID=1736276 RepID=UPI0009E74D79|nr:DUF262 domain-containing protein [Microbacterium sp. Leaf151]